MPFSGRHPACRASTTAGIEVHIAGELFKPGRESPTGLPFQHGRDASQQQREGQACRSNSFSVFDAWLSCTHCRAGACLPPVTAALHSSLHASYCRASTVSSALHRLSRRSTAVHSAQCRSVASSAASSAAHRVRACSPSSHDASACFGQSGRHEPVAATCHACASCSASAEQCSTSGAGSASDCAASSRC
jgi:hypothetical protein